MREDISSHGRAEVLAGSGQNAAGDAEGPSARSPLGEGFTAAIISLSHSPFSVLKCDWANHIYVLVFVRTGLSDGVDRSLGF